MPNSEIRNSWATMSEKLISVMYEYFNRCVVINAYNSARGGYIDCSAEDHFARAVCSQNKCNIIIFIYKEYPITCKENMYVCVYVCIYMRVCMYVCIK